MAQELLKTLGLKTWLSDFTFTLALLEHSLSGSFYQMPKLFNMVSLLWLAGAQICPRLMWALVVFSSQHPSGCSFPKYSFWPSLMESHLTHTQFSIWPKTQGTPMQNFGAPSLHIFFFFLVPCPTNFSYLSSYELWSLFPQLSKTPIICVVPTSFLVAQMVKNLPAMQESQVHSLGQEDPWRREWQPTPVFLPGEFHGQKSLVGYSPWDRKESDSTEQLTRITLLLVSKFLQKETWDGCVVHLLFFFYSASSVLCILFFNI